MGVHVRRVPASLLIAALLLAGCATGTPTPRVATGPSPAPTPCSPADPDRWAWFCVVGQLLYGAAAAFQPPAEQR